MAVLADISQTPLHSTQCCADWISVEAAGVQRRNITMRQLEPSYISALEIFISAAAARLSTVMAAGGVLSLMRCCVCVSAKWTFTSGSVKSVAVDLCSPSIMPENGHWPGEQRGERPAFPRASGPHLRWTDPAVQRAENERRS